MGKIDWHFHRPELAVDYMRRFTRFGAKALALFEERQAGKTAFLQNDLAPAARAEDRIPLFIDVWSAKTDPGNGIADGFKSAALMVEKPGFFQRGFGLNAGFLGHSGGVNFGDSKKDIDAHEPSDELRRIGYWMDRLAVASKAKHILLMLDEIQTLATQRNGGDIAAALRAGFQRNMNKYEPVFTGSSRDKLDVMFLQNKAPLFGYGQRLDLPRLGQPFVEHVAEKFRDASGGLRMDVNQASQAFELLGYKPGLLVEVASEMLALNSVDITAGLAKKLQNERHRAEQALKLEQLSPLDRLVLVYVAHSRALFSNEARAEYAEALGVDRTTTNAVQSSIQRLRKHELVEASQERGQYRVADELLAQQLRESVHMGTQGERNAIIADIADVLMLPTPAATPEPQERLPQIGLPPPPAGSSNGHRAARVETAQPDKKYLGRVVDVTDKMIVQNVDGSLVAHKIADMMSGKYELLTPGNQVRIDYSGSLFKVIDPSGH